MFLGANNIRTTRVVSCLSDPENCPSKPELKIIQVRHPFERLLSTYRHVFKSGGWRTLEDGYMEDPQLEKLFVKVFSKSWPQFVQDVIIENQFRLADSHIRESTEKFNFRSGCDLVL